MTRASGSTRTQHGKMSFDVYEGKDCDQHVRLVMELTSYSRKKKKALECSFRAAVPGLLTAFSLLEQTCFRLRCNCLACDGDQVHTDHDWHCS